MNFRRFSKPLLLAAGIALGIGLSSVTANAIGLGEVITQETVTPPRACTALSGGAWGTAQVTLTMTPPSGQFVYICSFEQHTGATTAPAATLLNTTTTNLNGKRWATVAAATASEFPSIFFQPSQPLKSAVPGTAVTIVSNAAVTSVNYQLDVTFFFAP